MVLAPVAAVILPFIKSLAAKAGEGGGGTWGDLTKRFGSRVLLIALAAIVPLLLWLAMMQLAYWGLAISECPGTKLLNCNAGQVVERWPHAPALFQWLFNDPAPFHWLKVPAIYVAGAIVLLALWPLLSVNSNSLHQLYRDRLSSAFLIRRQVSESREEVVLDDGFCLTDINPKQAPYHLINTALNVPGSPFANRRGRNADFFLFSRCYIGSEATGYVET